MEELKESKETLPVSLLTDLISRGWAEVGNIKADIEAISNTYKGAKKIEDTLQALADSYLIAIGQLEAFAEAKDYVEFPEEEDKALKEDVNVNIEVKNYGDEDKTKIKIESDEDEGEVEVKDDDFNPEAELVDAKKPAKVEEPFEYFTDFDEPAPADEEEKIDLQEAFNLFN